VKKSSRSEDVLDKEVLRFFLMFFSSVVFQVLNFNIFFNSGFP
jgi:hypothetical protein